MRAILPRISTDGAGANGHAIEAVHVLASAAVLLAIGLALLFSVEAISAPLAGWAGAQTLASLAPV